MASSTLVARIVGSRLARSLGRLGTVTLGVLAWPAGAFAHARGSGLGEPQESEWHEQVVGAVEACERHFWELERGVFTAPNRTHGLRLRVSADGLAVVPRTDDETDEGATWSLGLRTARFGRVDEAHELPPAATVRTSGSRAELEHGLLVEWLENRGEGVEQGWTIARRPAGAEPLWIGLAVTGELAFRIDEGGRSGVFVDAGGERRLRYRDLAVFDATGSELDARFEPSPDGLGIRVDDGTAVYPLAVDPVLTGPDWTVEGVQDEARLGTSLAPAGDVNGDGFSDVVVGVPLFDNGEPDEGRAYLFLGSATGLALTPAWTGEIDQPGAHFGAAVALAGDVNGDGYSDVIVGAPLFDGTQTDTGRALVYHGSPAGLVGPMWSAQSSQAGAEFGASVATAGDVDGDGYSDVIVGARLFDFPETDEGGAYVYLGSASGLAIGVAWMVDSDDTGAELGTSVSTAGDVNGDGYDDVLVGAPLHGQMDEGAAFLHLGSSSGLATAAAWSSAGDQGSARYGASVATAGDVDGDGYGDVLVGAPSYTNGQTDEGRAYLYTGSAGGLGASAWTAEPNEGGAEFGAAVATAGDVNGDGFSDVIVGSPLENNGVTNEGLARVYLGSGAGLGATAAWTADGDETSAWFGFSVATAGDVDADGYSDVLVGAPLLNDGETNDGRAYLYSGSAADLGTAPSWTAESDQPSGRFGKSVASAGDVNGDGYADVIVGAFLYDGGQTDEGRAYLYLGSATGLAPTASWTVESDKIGARFGECVASAGDVNGDGYGDVIIGAPFYENDLTAEGRAYVYHGSSTGLLVLFKIIEGNQANAQLGHSVASAGDVNGDGYGDVIVGAYLYDSDDGVLVDEGLVWVYHGSSTGLEPAPAWAIEGNQAGAQFGCSVASAGDVNRNGCSDVIIGARFFDAGQADEGRVFVYHGTGLGLSATPAWQAESDQPFAYFGNTVATAGDFNGDGFSDVIVGAILFNSGSDHEGRAYVYLGSRTGLAASAAWTADGNQEEAWFGESVATAGDVNADGYSDVLIGALFYDYFAVDAGLAYLYLGSASGLPTRVWSAVGGEPDAFLGDSVASAGDVNGDGYADVIIGASALNNGETDEGRALLYLGNEGAGGGLDALQQQRVSGTQPIALLGRTSQDGGFRIRARFERNLRAFSWASPAIPIAHLEWEVEPLGLRFDGEGIERSAIGQTMEPAAGIGTFDELASAITSGNPRRFGMVRWRARIATNNPLFRHTAWFSQPGNNITEAKLRPPILW